MQFQDKVCVVTGAGNGIGRATALELGRRGGKVVLSDVQTRAASRRRRSSATRAARPSTSMPTCARTTTSSR